MDFKTLVGNIIGLINYAVPVFIGIALAIFFWGLVKFVYRTGDAHGKDADKQLLVWGLVALFVLVSVWGLVGLMCENFFGSPSCSAAPITIQSTTWTNP